MTEREIRVINGQDFRSLYDDGGKEYSDLHFMGCSFESCGFSITDDPAHRSVARRLRFTKCAVGASAMHSGILDDVVVDGLKTRGLFLNHGVVFRHVILTGRIGRVMFSPMVGGTRDEPVRLAMQDAFDQANRRFYESVDWALDISGAEFEECEIQGVPARLIRRDPATQVVVRRDKVMQGAWRDLDLSGTHWATSLDFLMAREEDDMVLVAPKRNKNFRRLLEGLETLRGAGIAE